MTFGSNQDEMKPPKVLKYLWADTRSGEIIVKNYGANQRSVSLFSKEELMEAADPVFAKLLDDGVIQPLMGTALWCDPRDPVMDRIRARHAQS